jgi:hypothetical protein
MNSIYGFNIVYPKPYHQFNKGNKVTVRPTSEGSRKSYPAANWITKPCYVILAEDAIEGTLDVFDVNPA